MGGAFSSIGSGLSKAGGAIKDGLGKVFSNSGDEVAGTGQTLGELKAAGWTPQDMLSMGLKTDPGKGTMMARGAMRGMLSQGGQALQAQQGQPRGGAPVRFDTNQPQMPTDLLWPDPNDPRRRMMQPGSNPNMFYGG